MGDFNISILYSKKPSYYFYLIRNLLDRVIDKREERKIKLALSGLEGAIVTTCDVAQMIVEAKFGNIDSIKTERVNCESRFNAEKIFRNKIAIYIVIN